MCSLQKYTFVCCGYSILGQATRLSGRFKGGKGGAQLVMYFSYIVVRVHQMILHVTSCHVIVLFHCCKDCMVNSTLADSLHNKHMQ